jgi:hypothetical protein
MKEAFWGMMVLALSTVSISFIIFFQNITTTDEHNYYLLKETTEAAMLDAVDMAYYNRTTLIRIDREVFVESFIRRFAEHANLGNDYVINFYDINETPPKVSVEVKSKQFGNVTGTFESFDIVNRLDAILETPY